MPVRSWGSSILRWPSREEVDRAVRAWAAAEATHHPEVTRVGYFGSYARGNWGVGSDVDLVVVVDRTDRPFERRASSFDATELPVPADVLVYTVEEWATALDRPGLPRSASGELLWVYEREDR